MNECVTAWLTVYHMKQTLKDLPCFVLVLSHFLFVYKLTIVTKATIVDLSKSKLSVKVMSLPLNCLLGPL